MPKIQLILKHIILILKFTFFLFTVILIAVKVFQR
jgi:hypothetical protein